jgi:hypothetical protein
MKQNKLTIQIKKPIKEVFKFCITPPNSIFWIPSIVSEETSEYPVKVGTIYKLIDKDGSVSEVTVTDLKEDLFVEWVSKDRNYHCRYSFSKIDENTTELEYFEWVDRGSIESSFKIKTLNKLKAVLEG